MNKIILDINEKPKNLFIWMGLSLQHLFTMFGATVLVPILVGIDPSIALFCSGIGTIVHLIITKFKIPAYMGSSFAFISTMTILMKSQGYGAVAQGAIAAGLVYLIISLVVAKIGYKWINKILPPVVVAPIIIVIGLGLANASTHNAMYNSLNKYDVLYVVVALFTSACILIFSIFFKGFMNLISILLGIICGYLLALVLGLVNLSLVSKASWFNLPHFNIAFLNYQPKIYWNAIIAMAPIAFVTMTEHIGHIMIFNEITGKNFLKQPGLAKTLAGDGFAQITSGLFGGPPVTSYGENIGVQAITKIFSVHVITLTALFAIALSFIGKISAIISTIPSCVIGGVGFVLFGVIATSGLKMLVTNKVDFDNKKNLLITSIVLIIGIGNLILNIKGFELSGMAIATFVAIILNLIIKNPSKI